MIEFKNVHLQYAGKKVLQKLSFKVREGEKVAVLGKSGSGKSSLFQMALGFVNPTHGKIFFDGILVNGKSSWKIRKQVAYIDQDVSLGNGKVSDIIDFISALKAAFSTKI